MHVESRCAMNSKLHVVHGPWTMYFLNVLSHNHHAHCTDCNCYIVVVILYFLLLLRHNYSNAIFVSQSKASKIVSKILKDINWRSECSE